MLKETIQQALDKGLIKSGTIIVDSTHTNASVRAKPPTQILRDLSKQLRKEIEASEKFQERLKIRHRIEEKNGELKEAHGLGRADSVGLFAMEVQMQMYFTAFAANIKRITKLIALAG